jgi:succinate dehydrogenase / fumarate reductase cytochrome b subunit
MTAPAKPVVRPLSPHLQIYRLPLAALISITHRITGVGLALGTLLLTYWVTAAASGPAAYGRAMGFIGSWFGMLLLLGFSIALFFHLCNGIRHLVWDTGRSFDLKDTARGNVCVIVGTIVLTLGAWAWALLWR